MNEAVNDNDILELKFEGNGINPKTVKPSDAALVIKEFESALLNVIKKEYPQIDTSQILFTLDSIKDESFGLNFLTSIFQIPKEVKFIVVSSFFSLTTAIGDSNFSNLPNQTISSLKEIQKFAKNYNCTANFRHGGEYLASITEKSEIKLNKETLLKGYTTIYGELIDAGGDNPPNIHLRIKEGVKPLIIKSDKETVKKLAGKLYTFIGLSGLAKWNIETSEIENFEIKDILEVRDINYLSAIKELRNISSGYWDNLNDDEINNLLLRD